HRDVPRQSPGGPAEGAFDHRQGGTRGPGDHLLPDADVHPRWSLPHPLRCVQEAHRHLPGGDHASRAGGSAAPLRVRQGVGAVPAEQAHPLRADRQSSGTEARGGAEEGFEESGGFTCGRGSTWMRVLRLPPFQWYPTAPTPLESTEDSGSAPCSSRWRAGVATDLWCWRTPSMPKVDRVATCMWHKKNGSTLSRASS